MKLAHRFEEAPDTIEAWLSMLTRVLRLPEADRASIREELDCHLRERVRDLVVSGVSEEEATRIAIGELGDAATLATRFEAARRPGRRFLMHSILIAVAGAGLTTGILALGSSSTPPTIVPPSYEAPAPLDHLRMNVHEGLSVGEVLQYLAEVSDHDLFIHRNQLEIFDVDLDAPVDFALEQASISTVLRLMNESLQIDPVLELRAIDGILEVSTRHHFDRLETVITMYDIEDTLPAGEARDDRASEIRATIMDLIEPDCWVDNGGETATIHLVDSRMFVSAPPRIQDQVAWILDRLRQEDAVATKVRSLRYAPAGEVAPVVRAETGLDVTTDVRSNSLLYRGTSHEIARIEGAISALDVAPERPETCRVHAGDTLSSIAARHGVSVDDLLDANPGLERDRVAVGRELALPR